MNITKFTTHNNQVRSILAVVIAIAVLSAAAPSHSDTFVETQRQATADYQREMNNKANERNEVSQRSTRDTKDDGFGFFDAIGAVVVGIIICSAIEDCRESVGGK